MRVDDMNNFQLNLIWLVGLPALVCTFGLDLMGRTSLGTNDSGLYTSAIASFDTISPSVVVWFNVISRCCSCSESSLCDNSSTMFSVASSGSNRWERNVIVLRSNFSVKNSLKVFSSGDGGRKTVDTSLIL